MNGMTREELERMRDDLAADQQQCEVNYHQVTGALNLVTMMLNQLAAAEAVRAQETQTAAAVVDEPEA